MKKLSFDIQNIEMIQENPDSNFALLSLDFFASGDNLHNMYVSEETLLRTADSIKNCPLVWKYDEVLDDVYTHDPEEVPCGFVPESSQIIPKKLEDGRTMLSAIAYVWKRYTGPLLDIFKRDGGKKPVSVEMSVYKTQDKGSGKTELLDFRYEGITVLGSYVTPAIPMAGASILSFARDYEEDLEKEFSFTEIIIPPKVRENVERGFQIRKEEGGGTTTALAYGRYLSKNRIITPEKVKEINTYFSTHEHSKDTVDWLLFGGNYGKEWIERTTERIEKGVITFPYKTKTDMNPALKGITPPITVEQGNAIAKQADSIGITEDKNGWAIAISSFKKTHHVEDGKWVKNKSGETNALINEDISDLRNIEYWENIVEENVIDKNIEKRESIVLDTSKEAMSDAELETIDEASLMQDILNTFDYKTLVHDVYLVVDSGWEEHPGSSLHYPIMNISDGKIVYNRHALEFAFNKAIEKNEEDAINKINSLYEKLGLDSEKKEMDMKEELVLGVQTETKEEENITIDTTFSTEITEPEAKMAIPEEPKEEVKPEAQKKEEAKEKKFEFPLEKMQEMFSEDEDEDDIKMAKAEIAKGKEADFGLVMQGAYAKMCKMAKVIKEKSEEAKAYMAENEQLKKFRVELEGQQKEFTVNETLKELSAAVYLPEETREELRAESAKYALENMEAWKDYCKARTFDFAIRMPKNQGVIEVGLPFSGATKKKASLWD